MASRAAYVRARFVVAALVPAAFALLAPPPARAKEAGKTPVIILKLDDLRGDARPGRAVSHRWQRVADLVESKGIKGSFGISSKDLDKDDAEFFKWVKALHGRGAVEFWNHGHTHGKEKHGGKQLAEFQMPYDRQLRTLRRTQRLAREKLGFPFKAFGAPFNAVNATTARALEAEPDLDVWLYGNAKLAREGKFTGSVLERTRTNIESPLFVPNLKKLQADLRSDSARPCLVLQGHPGNWDDSRFREFARIVDFLREQGCEFMTPSEYAAKTSPR